MQLPLLVDRSGAESLTDQIARQIRQAIASAQLAGGVRLPSSRQLAEQLEVARNTVMRAYEALMAEGWVESRPASGLFVAAAEPIVVARVEPSASAPGRSSWSIPLPALPNPPAAPAAHRRGRLSHDFAPGRACGATNVNPTTGERDLDIPSSLRLAFGHKNLGVYLVVREGGVISAGDRLALSGEGKAPAEAAAPVLTAARGRFICRGCYYIYDEAQGAPHAGAPFDALSSDWRCPDCGTDKTTFRPHVESAA